MKHYQEQYQCSKCKRWLVVDIGSIGIGHQSILAVTCRLCAKRIMKKGDVEEPKHKLTKYGKELVKKGILDKDHPQLHQIIQNLHHQEYISLLLFVSLLHIPLHITQHPFHLFQNYP